MIKCERPETGMIRGYVVVGDRYSSCIGKDRENCVTAYTFWYRHDDDLTQLERDVDLLQKAYSAMPKWSGMMIGFEAKPYRK